ncbi:MULTISPECIES: hypothetical protein [Enterococcus]|uniref:Uncharacterized protein n=1 Tax=Enterococcus diestrammenae TaxID=1155073 RepID=A0ABV0F478_9ENTE|nr:hypothetical protein [Enterococcus diestrammenae]KAF1296700.1 hypothetical protein BAU18_14380 [Enterococcus diestrammenae]
MATFGKFDNTVVPSDLGKKFQPETHVQFLIYGKPQTGTVTKQLKNSAVVELDHTPENEQLITQSNGVMIINYKKMQML